MNDTSAAVSSVDTQGGTPAHYDQFFGPLFFEPYALEVAKRIDPDAVSFVLETAAGTGRVTRHIRERIPASAKLVASDISADMLAEAKKKNGVCPCPCISIAITFLVFDSSGINCDQFISMV